MARRTLAALALSLASCVFGDDEPPGCRSSSECERGAECRAGVCLRFTTDASALPADAGGEADARGSDADARGSEATAD